jgi:hypothetical protein
MPIGLIFAIVSSIALSGYLVPRKFSKQIPELYMVFFGVMNLVTIVLLYCIAMLFDKNL